MNYMYIIHVHVHVNNPIITTHNCAWYKGSSLIEQKIPDSVGVCICINKIKFQTSTGNCGLAGCTDWSCLHYNTCAYYVTWNGKTANNLT